jgi:hypothetical protein
MKKTFAVATIVIMASSLAACGGNDDDSSGSGGGAGGGYCDTIQSVKDEVASGNFDTLTQAEFDSFQSKIADIQSAAPDDVADDWQNLGDYLNQFESLLKDAGISLDDLQSLESGDLPSGVDTSDLTDLATKLQTLTKDNDIEAADKAITASAKSECDINLDDSGSTPTSEAPAS